jgi:hypothetical protein
MRSISSSKISGGKFPLCKCGCRMHYLPASDSTYYYFNGCGNEADIPRIPGLLGRFFPLSETRRHEIRSHSQPVGSPRGKSLSRCRVVRQFPVLSLGGLGKKPISRSKSSASRAISN